MTLDQIDGLLAAWRAKLDAAAQGLVDLRSHPAYLQLSVTPELTGVTQVRVGPMLDSIVTLFDTYDRLQSIMARAEAARKEANGLFGSPEKAAPVLAILTKRPVDNSETPEELLAKLNAQLASAKEVVTAVDAAWRQLNHQLDAMEKDANGLKPRIDAARKLVATDPLGAQAETDAIGQVIARRKGLQQELKTAAKTLADIGAARAHAADTFEEAQLKIQNAKLAPPCGQESLDALDQWLKTLNGKMSEGAWDAVAVGLDRWKQSAAACLQSEIGAAESNQKPVLERRELRGRLDALRAKAVAKGKSEDPELARLGKQARALLQTNPTSLLDAEQAVREYERRLTTLLWQK